MRAKSAILLLAFAGLTISCAHKPTLHDTDVVEAESKKEMTKTDVQPQKSANNLAFTCLVGKDKRTVTLDKKEKGCEVNYQKFGEIKQVAWAENTPAICDRAFNNIRSNIEKSGFKCVEGNDISMDGKPVKADKPMKTAANSK